MTLVLTSLGPRVALMLTSPGPRVTLLLTSRGPYVTLLLTSHGPYVALLLNSCGAPCDPHAHQPWAPLTLLLNSPGPRVILVWQGFDACLATAENDEKKKQKLRFKVGDRVECNMSGGEWQGGTVLELLWRDDDMEQGQVCPYKV